MQDRSVRCAGEIRYMWEEKGLHAFNPKRIIGEFIKLQCIKKTIACFFSLETNGVAVIKVLYERKKWYSVLPMSVYRCTGKDVYCIKSSVQRMNSVLHECHHQHWMIVVLKCNFVRVSHSLLEKVARNAGSTILKPTVVRRRIKNPSYNRSKSEKIWMNL